VQGLRRFCSAIVIPPVVGAFIIYDSSSSMVMAVGLVLIFFGIGKAGIGNTVRNWRTGSELVRDHLQDLAGHP
jgi:hypothetical protein